MENIDALFERVRAGDRSAFSTLYDTFSRLVFGVALRVLTNPDLAEEITQEVFLKIWRSPESFRGGNFAAWIARVTRNLSLDQLRARSRQERFTCPEAQTEATPDIIVVARDQGERVRTALEHIPSEQRIPIELGFFGGITHEEIALQLSMPLGTVKTRIRSGLQKLRRALSDEVMR